MNNEDVMVQDELTRLKRVFVGYEGCGPEQGNQNAIMLILLCLSVFVSGSFSVINYLQDHQWLAYVLMAVFVAFIPLLAGALRNAWLPKTREALITLAFISFVALFVDGGIGGTGIYWSLLFPFLAFLLSGVRAGWRWMAAFILVNGLAALLNILDLIHFSYNPDTLRYAPSMMLFFIVIASAFQLQQEKRQSELKMAMDMLELKNEFIRKIFGRYMSDDVVEKILETPDGIDMGGQTLPVTIMFTDLRGFSAISESLPPTQVVEMLNIYLEEMTRIIFKHSGTINELMGDGLLIVFGAPTVRDDDAERAIACAIDMQMAMPAVNARLTAMGFPELEMGIGINSGQVVAGNLGSDMRTKYAVVGSAVNMAARVESFTVGGQVLATRPTMDLISVDLKVAGEFSTNFKGIKEPVRMYDVVGIAGDYDLNLPKIEIEFRRLVKPLPLRFEEVKGKASDNKMKSGSMLAISKQGKYGIMAAPEQLELRANVKISLETPLLPEDAYVYAKVMGGCGDGSYEINFTFMTKETRSFLGNLKTDGEA